MTAVGFYHMTTSSAESALAKLMAKTLGAEKRALICCAKDHIKALSSALWAHDQGSWLPHGVEAQDDGDADLCPIWLAEGVGENPNGAHFFFFVDSAPLDKIDQAERAFILFDGRADEAVQAARGHWTSLKDDHDLSYWTEDGQGKWTQTA